MQCKFGKEKKLFTDERFRVKYGTIDAVKLNAVYINVESWVQPKDIENYDSYIRLMRKQIIVNIKDKIDKTYFKQNFIVDLDLRASGMSDDKKSFIKKAMRLETRILQNINYFSTLYSLQSILLLKIL